MTYIILSALAIMLASLSGILFVWKSFGSWTESNLRYLATCSIGVFAVIVYGLFTEALEHRAAINVGLLALAGLVTIGLVTKLIPDAHHHHGGTGDHDHSHIDARRMMLGDAIHNIGDGLLLVPAFAISTHVGIATAVAVFFHELVQEISEFFVLRQAGYSNKEALGKNFLVSSTILVGVFLSLALSSIEGLADALIPFAAGGFLYVILRDLVPHALRSIKRYGKTHIHVSSLLIGAAAMIAVTLLAPHGHGEKEEGHGDQLPEAPKSALIEI